MRRRDWADLRVQACHRRGHLHRTDQNRHQLRSINELSVHHLRDAALRPPPRQPLLRTTGGESITWQTNSLTWVHCDDADHVGEPVVKVETAFNITAGEALAKCGWTYNHGKNFHRCPTCTNRIRRRN